MKPFNKKYANIYFDKKTLYTRSLDKNKFFDERIVSFSGNSFREWEAKRSKLAAGLMKGLSQIGLRHGSVVLYLGASHGYTPSFVSDIVGKSGFVFAIDIAPEVTRDLVAICEQRKNMAPILCDCNHPEEYKDFVTKVDIVYQDISQKNQVQIFLKNCDMFLKKDGFGLLAIKSRSIDVTKSPKEIYARVREELEKHITIVDYRELDPYEKHHAMFVVKKK
ncbi:fibrillarin-like rRNA/tRNA 2'-O-methyltransferase [archaeon]|nr:fibrillarin-like rRNA/tRNA 2'-O-methyltransferase [archaeon]MBL7057240.1 fibrillarin-like rRNA/tRNA 2'-O-methyltransferase [Candidatus Woesearchaeota archaeon]